MAEEVVLPIPNLELPQYHYALSQSQFSHLHDEARQKLLAGIEKDSMLTFVQPESSVLNIIPYRDGTVLPLGDILRYPLPGLVTPRVARESQ